LLLGVGPKTILFGVGRRITSDQFIAVITCYFIEAHFEILTKIYHNGSSHAMTMAVAAAAAAAAVAAAAAT
jgi:hypothetical protein